MSNVCFIPFIYTAKSKVRIFYIFQIHIEVEIKALNSYNELNNNTN